MLHAVLSVTSTLQIFERTIMSFIAAYSISVLIWAFIFSFSPALVLSKTMYVYVCLSGYMLPLQVVVVA